jgi:sterol desaturase/sphingolipid hydroxylase (fatty acid hydroxylase superfamily)
VPGIDVRIRPTRLVVFGDSDFIANGALAGGGMDLFMSALNWLLERDAAIGIAPRPFIEAKLLINKQQINRLFWMAVCGLPGIVALLGGLVWLRRRG